MRSGKVKGWKRRAIVAFGRKSPPCVEGAKDGAPSVHSGGGVTVRSLQMGFEMGDQARGADRGSKLRRLRSE